jgi:parallel beta-helix repeat protein
VLIEDNLIEKFGQCQGDGHLDHGVYLGSGSDITIRNNLVRGNSSRGIQLNTEGGAFGTLSGILIERNRITGNGHRDYEDGIVVNGAGAGAISNLVVRRNLIYRNYYAGIRFVGDAISGITIEYNTFVDDGAQTSAPGRSEVNLDGGTPLARSPATSSWPSER